MNSVVDLSTAREEREPHTSGEAKCMACGHKWVAVAPTSVAIDNYVECPECGLMRGLFTFPFRLADEEHWECSCGNDLFHITPNGAYCPNCCTRQNWGSE